LISAIGLVLREYPVQGGSTLAASTLFPPTQSVHYFLDARLLEGVGYVITKATAWALVMLA